MKTEDSRPNIIAQYVYTVLICASTALVCLPLAQLIEQTNIVMLFLLAVAIVAALLGRGPAIAATFLNVALFDFLFVSPQFSFAVHDTQYLITFVVMLVVALMIGHLSIVLKKALHSSLHREQHIKSLYDVARDLAGVMTREQVIIALRTCLERSLPESKAILLLPAANGQWQYFPVSGDSSFLPDEARISNTHATGITEYVPATLKNTHANIYLPLCGSTRTRGVLAIAQPLESAVIENHPMAFLQALASLTATTLERLHYVEVAQASELQIQSERLRNSILSALSHDLRTPLTVLCGMTETLMLMQNELPQDACRMIAALRTHAFRLENMVANLLEMARLESGQVKLRLEWQPIEEVIGSSIRLLGEQLANHPIKVDVAPGMPLLNVDAILMERVFCNLLENAGKYSPEHAAITIHAGVHGDMATISVFNEGEGFPNIDGNSESLFEKFRRGPDDTLTTGFGMGLAICRSIIEIHGGTIQASSPPQGGACIIFTLPLGSPPSMELPPAATGNGHTGTAS